MDGEEEAGPGPAQARGAPSPIARRAFLDSVAGGIIGSAALPVLSACSSGGSLAGTGSTDPSPPEASATSEPPVAGEPIGVSGDTVTVRVGAVPALSQVPGFLFIERMQVVVVRTGDTEFNAFSSVCTHDACDVGSMVDGVMFCPCHSSEFDLDGRPIAGPAPSPLERYASTFDPTAGILTVVVS